MFAGPGFLLVWQRSRPIVSSEETTLSSHDLARHWKLGQKARMFFRALPTLLVAAFLASLPACAADASEEENTDLTADELTNSSLKNVTILKGSMAEGASITVQYQPDLYPTSYLPFLAIEITPAQQAAASGGLRTLNGETGSLAPLSINVDGNFPGSPRVLVVDEEFHVLASANGVTTNGGAHATVTIPQSRLPNGKKLVLIRDRKWVLPMDFQVSAVR